MVQRKLMFSEFSQEKKYYHRYRVKFTNIIKSYFVF